MPVVREAREAAELCALELGRGGDDLLAEEPQLQPAVIVSVVGASGSRRRSGEGERDEQQPRKLRQSERHVRTSHSSLCQQVDREHDRQHDRNQGGDRNVDAAQDEPRRALALSSLGLGCKLLSLLDWIRHAAWIPERARIESCRTSSTSPGTRKPIG